MRVLVCGGREYADRDTLFWYMDMVLRKHPGLCICHGGATGADSLAGDWASERGVPVAVFNANWDKYGKAAGPMRNKLMACVFEPHAIVAFPGGRGTRNMCKIGEDMDIPVAHVTHDTRRRMPR